VTTRNELRNAAATLQRLNVRAVGFVLNRVGLTKADPAFRASVEAVEKHLQAHSNNAPRRAERSTSLAPEEPISIPAAPKQTSARSMFEPEVAAAAAAVARFSPRAVAEQSAASTDCLSSPQVPPPSAEAAQRFSLPLSVPMTQTGRAVSTSSAEPPILPSPTKDSSPFAEAARYFASSVAAESARSYSPRPISSSVTGNPLPATAAEPVASPLPTEQTFVASEPVPAQRFESNEPSATPAADLPWWLSDVPRHAEQPHPPLLWQPAKVSTSVRQPADVDPTDGAEDLDKSLQKLQENQLQTSSAAAHSWESVPFLGETPRAETERASEEARNSATQGTQDSRNSRLGSLRNLLFVLGVSEDPGPEESVEQHKGLGSDSDLKTERPTFDQSIRKAPIDPSNMRGASPRLVTAPPEFLPPKPVVIEFEKKDARAGESSTRQDRRAPADGIDILPSKRGQYKKI